MHKRFIAYWFVFLLLKEEKNANSRVFLFVFNEWKMGKKVLACMLKWNDIFYLSYAVWDRDGLIWSNWSRLMIFHVWSKGPNIKTSKLKAVGRMQLTGLWPCKMVFFMHYYLYFVISIYAQCISLIQKWPVCGCPVH